VAKNLYVGNLASTDGRELQQLLSRFGIVRFAAPVEWAGRTLDQLDLAARALTLVAVRHGDQLAVSPAGGTALEAGDELVVIGADEQLATLEPG